MANPVYIEIANNNIEAGTMASCNVLVKEPTHLNKWDKVNVAMTLIKK